jgi:UDP-N-acetylmuramoyl-tripeptide--D-alanyl-D-alanine ligase
MDTAQLYAHFQQHSTISTDSRHITEGCIFFALRGEKFDGNQFAHQALAQGASLVVVDDQRLDNQTNMLLVPDVLRCLQDLARHHRRQFHIPIIAIGGSNGKTTTKELVSAVLSSHYPCHFTRGNFNNHIGVPLTLLAMPTDTEVAVIEMGANHPGEIAELCRIAEPTHGLVTNIGKEHLEGFGSLEGVKKAEGELYRHLARHQGCAFVNGSEKYLKSMTRTNRRKVTYAQTEDLTTRQDAFVEVKLVQQIPFVEAAFLAENGTITHVQTQLFGRHNFHNIMSAIALGTYFKVPATKIKAALEAYTPANNRSQIVRQSEVTYLMDAYNANPSSMEAALDSFAAMQAPRKVAILGDMLELGADSAAEHARIVRRARRHRFDQLVLVGAEFGQVAARGRDTLHFADVAAARTWLQSQPTAPALILLKGSRGIRLEQIVLSS